MNMMQQRKGTPFLSIGAGSRFDRDRRSWRRLNARGGGEDSWFLLMTVREYVARGAGAVSEQ